MNAEHVAVELNTNELRSAGLAWAYSYWFSFSYVYYGSPALLAEQEVRRP